MWFRNLQLYRLAPDWSITLEALDSALGQHALRACGSQESQVQGWVPPLPEGAMVHSVGGQWLICLGIEQRLLPMSVVRQVADDRAADIAAEQGYKPGRKQMKDLRESVRDELLPRAFVRRARLNAWIDPKGGWLVVDAPAATRAELLLETLRDSVDSLPVRLPRCERDPSAAMADWLAAGEAPEGFSIDQDCELRALSEEKGVVRYARHALDGDDVRGHLAAGKRPTRLALTHADRVSFILTDQLELKRVAFLDVVKEQLDGTDSDAQAVFDASFALMTGELSVLLPAVLDALGGEVTSPGPAASERAPAGDSSDGVAAASGTASGDAPF